MTGSIGFLRTAQASGDRWGSTVKAVLTALGPLPPDVNFGLAYVTEALAEDFSSIMTFLRETTPVKQWAIAVAAGLTGPLGTVRGRPALAVLVARLPSDSFQLLDGWQEPRRGQFLAQHRSWLAAQQTPISLLHGDAMAADLSLMVEDLARSTGSFVIGAVTPHQPAGLSGVILGSPLTLVTGLTQGCVPLGPPVRVTEASDDIVMSLDGRPALDVMKEQLDAKTAQDLRRVSGMIHVGLPVTGADRADYLVRPLMAIDPTRGWLAIGSRLAIGDPLIFVKRDGDSARKDMRRMLEDIAQRLGGRSIKGGIYISCVARGEQMFGSDDAETAMILQCLGEFPLIGLISHGEFCHDRLYGFTGVLAAAAVMMRLFVGLSLPEPLTQRLAPMMTGLPGARWVDPENLHLTLRFIGEVDEREAAILDESLLSVVRPCFDLMVTGCGIFAHRQGPEAAWIGVASTPPLSDLQGAIERAAVRAGLAPEEKRYRPHITLARLKDTPPQRLQSFVSAHNLFKEVVPIDHFCLFSSQLRADKAVYRVETRYPLIVSDS